MAWFSFRLCCSECTRCDMLCPSPGSMLQLQSCVGAVALFASCVKNLPRSASTLPSCVPASSRPVDRAARSMDFVLVVCVQRRSPCRGPSLTRSDRAVQGSCIYLLLPPCNRFPFLVRHLLMPRIRGPGGAVGATNTFFLAPGTVAEGRQIQQA